MTRPRASQRPCHNSGDHDVLAVRVPLKDRTNVSRRLFVHLRSRSPERVCQVVFFGVLVADRNLAFLVQVARVCPRLLRIFPNPCHHTCQRTAIAQAEDLAKLIVCLPFGMLQESVNQLALLAFNEPEELSCPLFRPARGISATDRKSTRLNSSH